MWRAHALDEETRHRGSSGGALTALSTWNLEMNAGGGHAVAALPDAPRRTVPVTIMRKEDALAAAGSRYAPVAAARDVRRMSSSETVTGKPCEAAAMRSMSGTSGGPLILSFFCAGTPSQEATDEVITHLGGSPNSVKELWYRGRGWPGRFTAVHDDGRTVDTSYDSSWGQTLGPSVPWRCRTCGDGMGESADLVAGDLWDTDERGYPLFEEMDGVSVLIARTPRGERAARAAAEASYVHLEPVTVDEVLAAQPAQVSRRERLLGRLLPTVMMGLPVTRYRGFGLLREASRRPRAIVGEALGAASRLRARGYDWAGGRIRPLLIRVRGR
ncbi:MAG: Coenzyme F420 hydrogenase/dehydrogenase, beta subunit C-terminal domain [Brachybacterium sp.]